MEDESTEPLGSNKLRSRRRQRRISEAQAIVARYVARDRDLVAELIAERRDEAARD
jgi:hypothetical protein